MDRIVIGAMYRSGSTWAFNAARLLAAQVYGPEFVNAAGVDDYVEVPEAKIEILKAHDIDSNWVPATKIITCVRDLRDAFCSGVSAQLMEIESHNRRGLCTGVFAGIDLIFINPSYAWAEPVAGMTIRFEEMMVDKVGTLEMMGHYLFPTHNFPDHLLQKLAITLEILPEIAEEYDPEQAYLEGAHRHRQHVGIGGYRSRLPYEDVVYLESKYGDWFDNFNYDTGDEAFALGEALYE